MSSSSRKMLQAAAGSGGAGFYPYTIDNSARFNDNDSPKLLRTQTAGNRKIATFSFWVKRSTLGSYQHIITGGYDDGTAVSDSAPIRLRSDDKIEFLEYINGYAFHVISNAVFRDTSAWYHFVWVMDTTQATSSNRIKLYVNGVQQSFGSTSYPSQNYDTNYNASGEQTQIGYQGQTPSSGDRSYFDGYMAEFHYIDGTAYDASAFGEFKNGVWVPKSPSVTYGTNGFYLKFDNSGALGTDSSGNGNNFTSSGLTSSDQMIDTPTNNFCTLNPLYEGYGSYTAAPFTLSEGNLQGAGNSTANNCAGTMAIAGKNYFESTWTVTGNGQAIIGIMNTSGQTVVLDGYYNAVFVLGTNVQSMTFNTNDTIGVATDVDGGTVKFYRNGTLGYTASVTLTDDDWFPWVYGALNSTSVVNFGQSSFAYTPPTGYETLSTANLPEPAIGPNSTTTSDENFNTVLWTGNGSTQAITGVGFQPDLIWVKGRDYASNHWLTDVIRGTGSIISTSTTTTYSGLTNAVTSFDSDGFSLGNDGAHNVSGYNFVGWTWKANGSGVTNTDGSITSTVSANQEAGFSIVTYTGNGTAGSTVGHGLGTAPAMIIVKNRDATYNWQVGHDGLPSWDYYLQGLDTTAAQANGNNVWNDTAPSSSVFTVGTNTGTNGSGNDLVAYCFAEVEGFSKFGSYTGNGSTDGPFIYCGFRPAFILFKASSTTSHWTIRDSAREPYNTTTDLLYPNLSDAEYTAGPAVDILSNGFKCREGGGTNNDNGVTYIYMAFSEMPFRYSNAR